jgi:hypothetical protein
MFDFFLLRYLMTLAATERFPPIRPDDARARLHSHRPTPSLPSAISSTDLFSPIHRLVFGPTPSLTFYVSLPPTPHLMFNG